MSIACIKNDLVLEIIEANRDFLPYKKSEGFEAFILDVHECIDPIKINDRIDFDRLTAQQAFAVENKWHFEVKSLRKRDGNYAFILFACEVPTLDFPTRARLIHLDPKRNEVVGDRKADVLIPQFDLAFKHGIRIGG